MPVALGLLAGLAVVLFLLALVRPGSVDVVQERIRRYGVESEQDDEYAASIFDRVVAPSFSWLIERVARYMPAQLTSNVAEHLEEAGWSVSASRFVSIWLSVGLLVPIALAALVVGVGGNAGLLALLGLWAALGAYMPWLLLRRRISARTAAVDRSLPDAIDLIVTSVESGLGLQAAMLKVAEHIEGPVGELFRDASREVSIGRSREEAMNAMAERSGSREMRLLVRAIVQAERMGISIGSVLRNQSGEIRERRRMAAREQANKIPVKMTIPTVLFIFPTLFIVILGPVVLSMLDSFSG